MVLFIHIMGSTADEWLAASLEVVSNKLKCSESLAGVTLLALGNGASDLFSALAAGHDPSSGSNSGH
jgi:sodium/potassium/calcium exchanger 6